MNEFLPDAFEIVIPAVQFVTSSHLILILFDIIIADDTEKYCRSKGAVSFLFQLVCVHKMFSIKAK